MANLRENRDFKNLFASIKKRYEVGGVEDTTLEADVHTAIDNMITAIELGIGDEAFIGLFLPRFNRILERIPRAVLQKTARKNRFDRFY